ncbi:MAG: cytidine deaminase [Gemmatimonadetes bacterium]|nr:cytidine deaminase [Gemmatimonadota bacterium]
MGETEGSDLGRGRAEQLLELARQARANAYAPYSHFPVGAALLAEDGRIFTGVNVENASYGLTTCAERTAMSKAVSEGARTFQAIAVVGPEDDVACPPCGSCRQILHELGPEMTVIMPGGAGAAVETKVSALLPGAFGSERLGGAR